jgi:hypothetical protein
MFNVEAVMDTPAIKDQGCQMVYFQTKIRHLSKF